jgi:cobalt-zinc-cadmium efflux system membrane fusion protein
MSTIANRQGTGRLRASSELAAVCCALAALALYGCSKPNKAPEPVSRAGSLTLPPDQRAKVEVEAVAPAAYHRTLETTGTVAFDADQATAVLAPVSGPVSRLLVSVGAPVRRGETLATVSSPDFASAVSAYRKAVATARNLRRVADLDAKLFESEALSRREMEQAETDAVSAESDRDSARLALLALGVDGKVVEQVGQGKALAVDGVIRAPIAGTVVEKLITPGQLLQAGTTPCFTVADLSIVWVMANVFESDLPFVGIGDAADVRTSASPDAFPGRVDYVSAIVDPTTRAIAVRIVAKNPKQLLKKDLYVRVSIHSHRESRGILAPVSAILRDDENLPFLFVANPDGTFARHQVTIGSQVGDRVEVASGLNAGDRVVTKGGLFMQFAQNQ